MGRLTDFSDRKEEPAPVLSHEGLDVYKASLDLVEYVEGILQNAPKEYAHLSDQIRRSSSSIALNIAEGSGRTGPADRARFYIIARGSATVNDAGAEGSARVAGLARFTVHEQGEGT
jgi:hypothetical protein